MAPPSKHRVGLSFTTRLYISIKVFWFLQQQKSSKHLKHYPLNHYVLLDDATSEEVVRILHQWLGELNAQPLTDRVWVYSAISEPDETRRRSRDIHQRLDGLSPKADWRPFRVLFLGPNGNGSFSYRMAGICGGGSIGGISFGD